MARAFIYLLLTTVVGVLSTPALAQSGTERFGDYRVHYSVFNSTRVPADIARAHNLVRGEDRALVNISVSRAEGGVGQPAEVSGRATNLMQQAQTLEFREISESNATYYIAPLRHLNEERYHFDISIRPEGAERTHELTFTHTLYLEP